MSQGRESARRGRCVSIAMGLLAVGLVAAGSESLASGAIRLGSSDYVANGSGWGTVKPSMISNGGAPSGSILNIQWKRWGSKQTRAKGSAAIYRPGGGYYPRVKVPLRASKIGRCKGQQGLVYRTLTFRYPNWPGGPLGPWVKWSGSRSLCDYSKRSSNYVPPKRPPGVCGFIGDGYDTYGFPGKATHILAHRIRCKKARKAARRSGKVEKPKCIGRGCTRRLAGLRCRFSGIDYEADGTNGSGFPVQRVRCGNSKRGASWFLPRLLH